MNTYEDMLVTDIERIQRSRKVLINPEASRKEKTEALSCLELYRELGDYYSVNGDEDQKNRAKEILYEIDKRWDR